MALLAGHPRHPRAAQNGGVLERYHNLSNDKEKATTLLQKGAVNKKSKGHKASVSPRGPGDTSPRGPGDTACSPANSSILGVYLVISQLQ